MKLIVNPSSYNLWWGIYGLTEKIGWEDMTIFYEDGKRIGAVCLNTKGYLRADLDDLKADPEEADFVKAIEDYLADTKIHYWYYYDKKGSDDFHEVSYESAPKNEEGVKPRFFDIWHPDEGIGIGTIKSAVKEFASKFLEITDCEVQVGNVSTYEESIKSYEEHKKLFGVENPIKISFSEDLISELSNLWGMTEEEVLLKLNKGIK